MSDRTYGDTSKVIGPVELEQAFKGTNFGTDDFRSLLNVAILKKAAHYYYYCGHTITGIMQNMRLIGKNGRLRKRGIELLRAAYDSDMRGGA